MRYLKLYEAFKVLGQFGHTKLDYTQREQTIREICLELEDDGYEITISRSRKPKDIDFISIKKFQQVWDDDDIDEEDDSDNWNWDNRNLMEWEYIKEYLLRIKDYLGDDYIGCSYIIYAYGNWETIELDEDTMIDELDSVLIEYKNFKLYESFNTEGSFYENILNRNLINDAKDMALEYIDMGMHLHIDVFSNINFNKDTKRIGLDSIWIHEVIFDHSRDISKDYNEHLKIENIILYYIQLNDLRPSPIEKGKLHHSMNIELVERLKMAYPNEIII
jgi:hypothetical protein